MIRKLLNRILRLFRGPQPSPEPVATLEETFNTFTLFGEEVSYYRTFILNDDSVELQTSDRTLRIRLYRGGLRLEDLVSNKPLKRYVRVTIDNKRFVYPVDVIYSKYEYRERFMNDLTDLVLAHVGLMHPEEGKLLSQEDLNPQRWNIEHVDPS